MEMELCCPPILLDEIHLTMVFGVIIIEVAMGLNQLLKLGLLRHEVRL
jgi:hypothetical protein